MSIAKSEPSTCNLNLIVPPHAKLNVHLQNIMLGNRINFGSYDALEIGAGSTTDSLFDTSANEIVLPSDEMNIVVATKRPFAWL